MAVDKLFIYSVIGFFFGLYSFFKGFFALRFKRLVENTPTSKIRSIAVGLVEIYGKIVPQSTQPAPSNKLLESPFGGKKCVYYKYTVEVERSDKNGKYWKTVKKGSEGVPFYLQDDTGKVLVDPRTANVPIDPDAYYDTRSSSGIGKEPSQRIHTFCKTHKISHTGWFGVKEVMRYTECYLEPNEKLYVLGTAASRSATGISGSSAVGSENLIITKGKHDKVFYISDTHETEVIQYYKLKVIGGIYGGSLLSVVCLAVILYSLDLF